MSKTANDSLKISSSIFGVLFIFTILSAVVVSNLSVSATDGNTSIEDTVTITIDAACTLSGTGADSHTASLQPGIWTPDIGISNITAICNDPGGYAIYAIGYSNDSYDPNVNTNLYATVGTDTYTIPTDDYTSSPSDSFWSMKLAQGTGDAATIISPYNSYSAVPNAYTKVATYPSTTAGTSGSSFTSTYGVYPSFTQAAGTYTGQVKYTLVHPNTEPAPFVPQPVVTNPGYISYNPNAPASTTPDSMGDQSISSTATSASLWASNFQRSGYGFAGWTDKYDWVLNENDADGNGTGANAGYHIYGPNQTISFTAGQYSGDNPGLSLYAVWVPSAGDLQNYTCPNNTTMPVGTVTALTDTRDNQTYAVAKLKDNKCWMVENLRLDNQYTTSAADIAKAQGYNSSFIGLANPETADFNNFTTANSLYSTDGSTAAPAITGTSPGYRFPRYNNQNIANPASNMTAWDNNSNTYSVGNYYTWHAAIADTTYYTSGDHDTTSICPSGWHIPTGNTSGEYYILNTEQNAGATNTSAGLRAYPANFIYSGDFSDSSAYLRGTCGFYWSSTARDGDFGSFDLDFSSSYVYPGTQYNYKYNGSSIRCSL